MAKAAEGNTAALSKLGIGLSSAQLKTMSMDEITAKLADTFENQAATKADTFQGKLTRLQIAFDEGKETVGSYILTAITPMVETIVNKVIPAIQDFTSNLGEKLQPIMKIIRPVIDGLTAGFNLVRNSLESNNDELKPFFSLLKSISEFVIKYMAPAISETLGFAFKALGKIISTIIDQFSNFVEIITKIYDTIKGIVDAIRGAGSAVGNFFSNASTGATSPSSPSAPYIPTPMAPSVPRFQYVSDGGTNITVNGAIDPISTARQIANILNSEATSAGSFSGLGVSRAYLA
jgi:phage-related minor tail protein